MQKILGLLLVFITGLAQAEETLPKACKLVPVLNATIQLKAEKPVLFLIHNKSSADLWITHPVTESAASAGWTSHLEPGNWSALMLDKKQFELSCIETKPGHEQEVPCVGLINICEWSSLNIPKKAKGTFWAGENLALEGLTTHLGTEGYRIP